MRGAGGVDSDPKLRDEDEQEACEADPRPHCAERGLIYEIRKMISLLKPGSAEADMCKTNTSPSKDTRQAAQS